MFALATDSGAELLKGSALRINANKHDNSVKSIVYADIETGCESSISVTDVVLAAGAWSSIVYPPISVGGAKCHSIILQPPRTISAHMLFLEITIPDANGTYEAHITPELYPRPDGTVYSCEAADPDAPLPKGTTEVTVDISRCDNIHNALSSISETLKSSQRVASQACFQPVVLHNGKRRKNIGPFLGPVDMKGLLIAAGHDSWGISNAPGTGKVLSELILDGTPHSAEISSLYPQAVKQRAQQL